MNGSRSDNSAELNAGAYSGAVNTAFQSKAFISVLAAIDEYVESNKAELIAGGRNQNIRVELPFEASTLTVLVKSFGKQSALKDWIDLTYRGSKAARSFTAAMHLQANGVGTPMPIAYLENRQGNRLIKSYFLTVFEENATSLHEAMLVLLHQRPRGSDVMALLNTVAAHCRQMHDAGFMHNDLGNQNILLLRDSDYSWHAPALIDLNRGRHFQEMTLSQRGQDLARLNIPSNLKLMFLDMYWGEPAPQELLSAHAKHVSRFNLRASTRKLRHPIREARLEKEAQSVPNSAKYPHPRDIWIWDDSSDQALSALDRKERKKLYPAGRSRRMLLDLLGGGPGIWRHYKKTKAQAFSQTVAMNDRIGLSLDPAEENLEQELELLQTLGALPVIVRFGHHETEARRKFQFQLVSRLQHAGCMVTVALMQDRQAVISPASWQRFVFEVLENVADKIDSVEIGHAINRVKWGVWSFEELKGLYEILPQVQERYPNLNIIGPATIDFEYPFLLSALKLWPESVPLSALSHHLYVDRRGAPENPQNGFSSVEKFALAKAIAEQTPVCSGSVVVSEVNWPIAGTAVHSPVTAPFEYANSSSLQLHDSGVSEQEYADFMLRYYVLGLCSGFVERVYWWRLVARGYGLVDIEDDGSLRERPAFRALRHFLLTLGRATFERAALPEQTANNHGEYRFEFSTPTGERIIMCWSHGPAIPFPSDINFESIEDISGKTLSQLPVELQGSPVYCRRVK